MESRLINKLLKETEHDIAVKKVELSDLEALAKILRRRSDAETKTETYINPAHAAPRRPATPLTDFIVSFLGSSPKHFAEIKEAASKADLLVFSKHPSQTVNMALAGLKHKKFADKVDGKWRLSDLLGGSEGGKT